MAIQPINSGLAPAGRPAHPDKPLFQRIRANIWSYVLVLPMVVLTVMFVWYPMLASIRYAFYNWNGFGEPDQFVGWRHFVTVATDEFFWKALRNTVVFTAVLVPVQLLLALAMALVLNNPRLRGAQIFRALFFIPAVCSIAVLAVPLRLLFTQLNANIPAPLIEAGLFNPSMGFLGDPRLALATVIGVGVWHTFGYNLVFFLAALQSVPQELYEAATVDGAGRWEKFWHITVPLIRPVGVIILFLAILGSMKVFDLVLVLTNGGPFYATEVVNTYIYSYAFSNSRVGAQQPNLGYASAASLFVSVLLLVITAVQLWAVGRARRQREQYELR
ncbi:MAG: sugar ABC transporter permease [Roseiflexaceae bacterium]